ncbi:hypothetical protein HN51_044520, partial [Arachis hypogaea]
MNLYEKLLMGDEKANCIDYYMLLREEIERLVYNFLTFIMLEASLAMKLQRVVGRPCYLLSDGIFMKILVHTKRRNRLHQKKMNNLVCVMDNL